MAVYFLSDTHLSAQSPTVYEKFIRYLDSIRRDADELYILGDLFDYWIGDDGIETLGHQPALDALSKLASSGTRISLMHGNRDFLIGTRFADEIGATLITDPTVIQLAARPTLLTHGDSLCTDDIEHQRYREIVLSPKWQAAILELPVSERCARALEMRAMSEKNKKDKSLEIMDVNEDTVIETMREFAVQVMIHGHTHRPAIHDMTIEGKAARRYVLGDWGRGNDAVIRVGSNGEIDFHEARVH